MTSSPSVVAPRRTRVRRPRVRRSLVQRVVGSLVAALSLVLGPLGVVPAEAATSFVVSGTISGEGAGPLADVRVELQQYDAGGELFDTVAYASTSGSGAFAFDPAVSGATYRVRAHGIDGFATVTSTPFTLSADRSVVLEQKIGGSLSGRVVAAGTGTPILGAQVTALPVVGSGVDEDRSVFTNADISGAFVLQGVAAGVYKVRITDIFGMYVTEYYADHTDLATAQTVTVVKAQTTPLGDITLAVGARLTGVLQDDAGGRVVDPSITAIRVLGDGSLDWDNAYSALVDPSTGDYTIAGLPAGSYKVSLSEGSDAYFDQFYNGDATEATANTVTVAAGAVQPLGLSRLERTATVTGTVHSAAGAPLGDINVDAFRVVNGTVGAQVASFDYTDTNGAFAVRRLHAGTYRLVVKDGLHRYVTRTLADVTVAAGGSRVVGDVVLQKVVVKKSASVRVSATGGTGKATFAITVRASGVTPTGKVAIKRGTRTLKTVTLKGGKVTVTVRNLPKGRRSYTVAYAGDARVLARSVTTRRITIR